MRGEFQRFSSYEYNLSIQKLESSDFHAYSQIISERQIQEIPEIAFVAAELVVYLFDLSFESSSIKIGQSKFCDVQELDMVH